MDAYFGPYFFYLESATLTLLSLIIVDSRGRNQAWPIPSAPLGLVLGSTAILGLVPTFARLERTGLPTGSRYQLAGNPDDALWAQASAGGRLAGLCAHGSFFGRDPATPFDCPCAPFCRAGSHGNVRRLA